MRTVLLILILASSSLAQSAPAVPQAVTPGCGSTDVDFSVKTQKDQHPFPKPDADKALVYFAEDDSNFGGSPDPTVRVGLDGSWIGATHGNSYFYFNVTPGEHHLCASWQLGGVGQRALMKATHFEAQAGKTYFFEAVDTFSFPNGGTVIQNLDLKAVNSDEGELLASQNPFSTSQAKK